MIDQTAEAAAGQENQQTAGTQIAQSSDATTTTQSGVDATASAGGDGGTITDKNAGKETQPAEAGDLQRLREQLAGGDEKFLKHLERYKSVEAITKMVREARQAAQNSGKPLTLSDKATEDEVKAYREAMGIPAEAKDYPVSFSDDFKATDQDKAILDSFKAYLHQANADPRAAKAALGWYQDFAKAQQQELSSNLAKVAKETQSALRTEWGGEYDGNLNAASELMKAHLGEDGFDEMMDLRLMDGSRLQDNIAFVKMMAQIGGDYYGGNAIINGDIETTAKSIDDRIEEYRKMQTENPEKYRSAAVQEQVAKLYAQKEKISARK